MVHPKWPERLVIVRHGQSEQNVALDLLSIDEDALAKQKKIRDMDVELTETGVWQAEETGKYLAETGRFDICFSSPYKRTVQTAQAIIRNMGYEIKLREDERLREKEFGRLHGFSKKEIRERFPEEFERRQRDGSYYYRLPDGENYPDVGERVHSFLGKLNRKYAGQSVLVVTHQVPYLMFRERFEHSGEKGILALGDVPNCGMEEFKIDTSKYKEGRMKLKGFNLVAY